MKEMQPHLVILDHFIDGDVMGLEAAPAIRHVAPDARILLFTSHDLEVEAAFLRQGPLPSCHPRGGSEGTTGVPAGHAWSGSRARRRPVPGGPGRPGR